MVLRRRATQRTGPAAGQATGGLSPRAARATRQPAALAAAAIALAAAGLARAAVEPGEQRGISKTVSRAALPGGLVLTVEPGSFAVERSGLRVPLSLVDRSAMVRALKGVDVDPDRGQVIATLTDSCDKEHAVNLTIADLNARLDDVAAETLAAGQLKSGKPADAVKTLAPLLAKAPIGTYARVATDPALAPLLRRPELARLRVSPPGTTRLSLSKNDVAMTGKGKTPGVLATSSRHRLVASIETRRLGGACAGDADLVLADAQGGEVARIPLYAAPELTTDEAKGCPFSRPARPRIAARVAAATRLLADLGLSTAGGEVGTVGGPADSEPRAQFPDAKLELVLGRDRVRILRGAQEVGGAAVVSAERIDAATYLPDLGAIVLRWVPGGRDRCAVGAAAVVQVIPVRAAP